MKKLIQLMALAYVMVSAPGVFAQEGKGVHLALKKLMVFEGDWSGGATLKSNDTTYKFAYHLKLQKTNDGKTLSADEFYDSDDLGKMHATGVIAFNSNDHKIHWFTADNMGNCRDHLGKWTNSTNFFLEGKEMIDGKSFTETIIFTFWGKNQIDIHVERKLDGTIIEEMEVSLRRTQ